MSLRVTLNEEPRVFNVMVGSNEIGRITSYFDEGEDNSESYHAERNDAGDDDEDDYAHVGWYSTLRDAGRAVVEYAHGVGKIDSVEERKV